MIAGFRNLVPQLRDAEDLDFDVLPMPIIDSRATVGDISGLCISADSEVTDDAADFIAYAVSDAAIATVSATGYIVPANTQVAASDDFLAPDDEPANSAVFNASIRYMVVPPFIDQREELDRGGDPAARAPRHRPGRARPRAGHRADRPGVAGDPVARGDRVADGVAETPEPTESPSE